PSGGGQVNYGYNALDQLASVKDPRGLTTSYTRDGLDNLKQVISPDTGTTNNDPYDDAGNLKQSTDAKNQKTTYIYDAINRVTSVTYQDQNGVVQAVHTYTYDQGTNGNGRLIQIVEPNSTTQYEYDQKGRLKIETRIISGFQYVTSYNYDNIKGR